jgi:hypothetical protein
VVRGVVGRMKEEGGTEVLVQPQEGLYIAEFITHSLASKLLAHPVDSLLVADSPLVAYSV